MFNIPCPQMNRYAVDRIDAYRRRDDHATQASAPAELLKARAEVLRINGLISAHRAICSICQKRAALLPERKPVVPVSPGTVASTVARRAG